MFGLEEDTFGVARAVVSGFLLAQTHNLGSKT